MQNKKKNSQAVRDDPSSGRWIPSGSQIKDFHWLSIYHARPLPLKTKSFSEFLMIHMGFSTVR
jgi:hypothetical protein